MSIRKILSLICIFAMVSVAVFANGAAESTSKGNTMPESIEVWAIANPNESIIKAYDDMASDFTAKYGVKVDFVRVPTNDFHTKLVTSISANVYPDVIIWNNNAGIEFSSTGKVYDMNELINKMGKDQFGTSVLDMFTVDGKVYEAPLFVRPAGLHARKSWLEKAGYDLTLKTGSDGKYYIEGLTTYEDLVEAGVKITDASNGKYGLGLPYSRKAYGDSAGFAFSVFKAYGARIIDENGKLDIDTPETRAALDLMRKVWKSGAVPAAATTWDGNSNNQFFISGDIGFCINSNSIAAKLNDKTAVAPDDLVMIPLLKGPNGAYMQANPESITVFETKNIEGAKLFAEYLLSTDVQIKMFETMGFGYYSPLKKDVMNSPLFNSLSQNEKVLLSSGDQYVSASYPNQPDARLAALYASYFYDDILSRIAVDDWTNDQIIKEMETRANEILFD